MQALTSPHLYDAAGWGLRVSGFNVPYWEANVVYHAVFTLAVPIALTDLLFPGDRGRPYLGRTGLVGSGVVALLGVGVLRASVPPQQDPDYQAPLGFVVACLVAVFALGFLALRILPRAPQAGGDSAVPPRSWLFGGAAAATLAFFALTFPMFGASQPAFTHGVAVIVPMLAAAVLAAASYALLRRMTASTAWTERDTVALIAGALVAHSIGGLLTVAHTLLDRIGLVAIIAVTVAALWSLDRRLQWRQ